MKHRKLNTATEKKILIGIITNKKFLEEIEPELDYDLLNIPYSRTIINWCLEFHKKFKRPPGIHIQDIYFKKKKNLEEETSDQIAKFLDNLSTEYEKAKQSDSDYLIQEALNYFNTQNLKNLNQDISVLLKDGGIQDAQKLIQKFSPIENKNKSLKRKITKSTITSTRLFKKTINRPKMILSPWLTYGSLNMIYAKEGVGKTLLSYIIGLLITREKYRDFAIDTWKTRRPAGCLIIDGEMDEGIIKYRLMKLAEPLGSEIPDCPLSILSSSAFMKDHNDENPPSIERAEWRQAIIDFLQNEKKHKVLILDNLFSLTQKINLLENQEWNEINQWLLTLRRLNIAVIILHHAGKSGSQLGASSRSYNLDNVIQLRSPKGYSVEKDGALFEVIFDKGRNIKPGMTRKFTLRIEEYGEKKWLQWNKEE